MGTFDSEAAFLCGDERVEDCAASSVCRASPGRVRNFCGRDSGGGELRVRADRESGELFRIALFGTDYRCGCGAFMRDEHCEFPAGLSAGDGRRSAGLSEPSADLHGESGTPDGTLADI